MNYPYIEFWHRLDEALLAESLAHVGPETIGDALWETLYSPGPLVENPDIDFRLARWDRFTVLLETADQLDTTRPASGLGDVGAIEVP